MNPAAGPDPVRVVLLLEMFCRGGGAEGQVKMLAQGLGEHGFEPEIWSYKQPPANLRVGDVDGARTRIIPGHGSWPGRLIWNLDRELRRARVQLLHSWMSSANFYARLAAGWRRRLPLLCAERTSRKLPRERTMDRILAPLTGAMVANSEGVRRYLVDVVGLRRTPIHLIPNGVDTARFHPAQEEAGFRHKLGIPPGALIMGTMGRHIPDKRQEWIIRAVADCAAAGLDVHAVIAGWGSERERLQREAEEAGVARRVHLVGVVAEPEAVLRSFQLFVLPSRREGMPNAALESMATGIPVVATEVAGIHDLLGRDAALPCGEVVPVDDEVAFREAVRKYLRDGGLRAAAGARGRQRAEERFSAQAMVSAYAALYREMLGRDARDGHVPRGVGERV